ncbi:MAG: nitroreductase family protein [Pseudomonadales bacterium]|nr:nitroreductase family protein [Pseudomonadales bacterium]
MPESIKSLIESRVSTGLYDSSRTLPDEVVNELVRLATRAPSAYNLQNWRFIAVRSEEAKARLKAAAYDQPQVLDAQVTFIVCGCLAAHEGLAQALQPSVEAGIFGQEMLEGWVAAATSGHENNFSKQRDEAFRSASLAAMTLMLAAEDMGLATGPMSGFDTEAVSKAFNLTDKDIPVMLITAGYAAENNWPQKPRKPLEQVLEIV